MLVVPGVNPVGYVVSCLGSGDIASVVDSFLLQGGEKRLGGGVVQSGAYFSHGLDDPQPPTSFGESLGSVLLRFKGSSQQCLVLGSVGVR